MRPGVCVIIAALVFAVKGISLCSAMWAGAVLAVLQGIYMWSQGSKCASTARLDGKTVIITGANTGIGKETALDLAQRGARVILACRNLEKARVVQREIQLKTGNEVILQELGLSSFASVRKAAEEINKIAPKVDVLINNAGVMMCPKQLTEDGFEMQFGTNHLGHFLFTLLLMKNIKAASRARIVNLSSLAHAMGGMNWEDLQWEKSYSASRAYFQSKRANVLFTKELAKRLIDSGVTTYAVHPGSVATDLQRHMATVYGSIAGWIMDTGREFLMKTAKMGAQTSIYCAVDEKAGKETGKYYSDCAIKAPHKDAESEEESKRLWDISIKLCELQDYNEI